MAGTNEVLEKFRALTERAYDNVYRSFANLAHFERTKLSPVIPAQPFVATRSDPQHPRSIEVRGALRIDKLPQKRKRSAGASRHSPSGLSVLLTSLDIYKFDGRPTLDNSFLYSSQVRLSYFTTKGSNWNPLLCVRYDFAKSHDAHPIFHAQLEDGVPTDEMRALFGGLPVVQGKLTFSEHVRLPSANVVGATALLSLAADHLPLERFPDVLRAVRDQRLFREDWRCQCKSMDEPVPLTGMLASRWYSSNLVAP